MDGPVVLSKVRVVPVTGAARASKPGSCTRLDPGAGAAGVAVERVGVSGESVTYLDRLRRHAIACDNTAGTREDDRAWCGGSTGRLFDGHLRDPRLDVLCSTKEGRRMGFVWIEPLRSTRYVAVEQPGYSEVYEPAGGLPVRIATTQEVSDLSLRVSIPLSEHDAEGKLLRRELIVAAPAG